MPNGPSDSPHQEKDGLVRQPPVKKPPPKPVWVDVSVLPRIPKIKRDSTSSANSSSSSSTLPESSANSLTGNTGRERTVDQQGTGASQQNRTVDAQRQRADRTGASSSFSSSFTSTTSSFSASSDSRPSSSSVSFRINASGNPWQARRLPASGGTLSGGDEESKRNNKSKQIMLSLKAKAKEEKSEVYDPFNPTGSDSSDNEPENEGPDVGVQHTATWVPIGANEDACHTIKSEPLDVLSDTERALEMCAEVKTEPESLWDRPCKESPHHSDTMHSPSPSGGPAVDSTRCEAGVDAGSGVTPRSPFKKTEEHSRSSSSCSEKNVKVEVKSEPETGPPPIRPQSKSLEESIANIQQASKGNGVCKELPSVSGAFNSSNTAKDKEERLHKAQSKDRKRSPSNLQSLSSKDSHKKKHSKLKEKRRSRSRDRQRSRSKSKERQHSRSRSKERQRPRSRDRRHSSSSSSRERKTSRRRASRERNDNRGRERHGKRSKERRRSQSRSFSRSRSRERRRTSKDQGERQKSRSISREHRRRYDRSEISRRTEKCSHKSTEPMSTELHEPALSAKKITTPMKTERDTRLHECETTVALPSVKVETTAHGLGSSRHDDPTRTLQESKDDVSLELLKPNEMKPEEPWPTGSVKELKDIKKEEEVCLKLCGELDAVKEMEKEKVASFDIFSMESPNVNEIKSGSADLERSHASLQDEMKGQEIVVEPKTIKIEKIWPNEEDSPSCSDNPLVIHFDMPDIDAVNCKKEPTESYQSPPFEEDMEMSPLQPPDPPIKQEPVVSSDEDTSVDYLIDNLDFIKKEMSESSLPDLTEAVNPNSAVPEAPAENKQTTETVTPGAKSKSQGKRVTWNLQEPVEPQSEKLSSE